MGERAVELTELDLDEPKAGEVLIRMEAAEDGKRVRVMISATPDACADCLVPKDLMRGILGQALGVPRRRDRPHLPR